MKTGIGLLSLVVVDEVDRFFKPQWLERAEAWQAWKSYLCIEWNGEHLWVLDLLGLEEDSAIYVTCCYCGTTSYDLYGDYTDLIYGTVHAAGVEIEIDEGRHSPEGIVVYDIPVNLELVVEEYGWEFKEYDVYLTLSDRV